MGRSEKAMGAVAGPGALRISEVVSGKRRYLPLLLLGDEQEDMIDRYLERAGCSSSTTAPKDPNPPVPSPW